jgi:hypothetical protein
MLNWIGNQSGGPRGGGGGREMVMAWSGWWKGKRLVFWAQVAQVKVDTKNPKRKTEWAGVKDPMQGEKLVLRKKVE